MAETKLGLGEAPTTTTERGRKSGSSRRGSVNSAPAGARFASAVTLGTGYQAIGDWDEVWRSSSGAYATRDGKICGIVPSLRLSVLDQSPIPDGSSASAAFAATIELARLADRLGYERYWLAEHHNTQGLAGSSPEVLIARVAAETSRIRVGSGGVMLSHYSPLKVAESFRVLHALYPGRIDLGVGRAPGSDQLTAAVLAQGRLQPIERFGQQLNDLAGFLYDALPPEHPYANVHATPRSPGAPEMWLLGSGGDSAAYAAVLGFAFSYAHFINPNAAEESLSTYRQHFRPLFELTAPRASMAVRVVCADTAAEARRIASSFALQRLRMEQGRLGRVPSVEDALAYPYSEAELARVEAIVGQGFVGDPDQVKTRLEHLAAALEIDELVVVTITHDPRARRHSYELLAEAFELDLSQVANSPSAAAT